MPAVDAPSQTLFVFDIETIPDTQAVHNLTGSTTTDIPTLRQELEAYHLAATKGANAFPRQMFHQVVAISFVEAEIERVAGGEMYHLKHVLSGRHTGASEQELLEAFAQFMARKRPRLVSFNGRGFDLPVLKLRAMKYGVALPGLFQVGDKWNSYQNKNSLDWHCDLLDALSDFGTATRGMKLNEVCAVFGFPGKLGVDGGDVAALYDAGQLEDIRNYCETDVLNTFLVYLRYQLLTGTLSAGNYNQAISQVITYIEAEAPERPHLDEFMAAWGDASDDTFLLP